MVWTLIYHARKKDVPTIFVKFEDLCMNPKPELQLLMSSIIGQSDLNETNAEQRIDEVIALGDQETSTYDLKDSSKKFCSSIQNYTQEQIRLVKTELEDMLYFFGYVKSHFYLGNLTGFFKFYQASDFKNEQNYFKFRKTSQQIR